MTWRSTVVCVAAAAGAATAGAANISVPGQANIFGAGMAVPPGGGQLPPMVALPVEPGQWVEFSNITGAVSIVDPPTSSTGPEGYVGRTLFDPQGGISGWDAPRAIFLTGVFVGGSTPTPPAPSSLDFNAGGLGMGYSNLSPALQQTFFIGDGQTGLGAGQVQRFYAPPGAERLYLGLADGAGEFFGPDPGFFHDNAGQWSVNYELGNNCPSGAWLKDPSLSDINGTVYALTTWDPDGAGGQPPLLVAGGSFSMAGATPAANIAGWNGTSWVAFGSGTLGQVVDLTVFGSDLIAGGAFVSAGGMTVNRIARWNGTGWSAMAGGANGNVDRLQVYNGLLYACGSFSSPGSNIAAWDGTSWSGVGGGLNGGVSGVGVHAGALVVGGFFTTAGGTPANRIASWNGTSWGTFGSGMGQTSVNSIASFRGELIAGGGFSSAGGNAISNIARWNGSAWLPLGSGTNGVVRALNVVNGDLIAGGEFTTVDGHAVPRIGRWNGSQWTTIGRGVDSTVWDIQEYAGQVVAAGQFTRGDLSYGRGVAAWTPRCVADMNCDGAFDVLDINPFVLALLDCDAYQLQYPGCTCDYGDINGDGNVDVLDINPFVDLLGHP